ncbi:solute carrier family 25 member 32 [Hetaerina americana]|uniref:solute carrier family 25 member 32 n=1 Tax=Hetaerina americana TaxID=62018 RepID=UPI003A7F4586
MTTMKASGASTSRGQWTVFNHVKYEHLVAGISGGVASTLILHPLDLIKIRFAVNDGRSGGVVGVGGGVAEAAAVRPQYRSLAGAISSILQQEGFRGLYRGVTPNVWGSGSAWGFYFLFYNAIKTWIQGGNTKQPLGPGLHMLAAAEAGVLTLVMTNPIWVVKTRLCLQYGDIPLSGVRHGETQSYNGMIDALKKIYTHEGIRGLYKGFVPGIFGVSHGALQFMTYEEMKNFYNQYRGTPIDTKLRTLEYLSFAAMSKLCAAAATYPYQVVRARLQDQRGDYTGTLDCIRRTWRYEGVRGFYKGLAPNLIRVTPATAIVFVVHENVSHALTSRRAEIKNNEVTVKTTVEKS